MPPQSYTPFPVHSQLEPRRSQPTRAGGALGRVSLLLGLCLLFADGANALPITFDASDIGGSAQPVNSLGSVMGVTFSYTIGGADSDAAEYGAMPTELLGDVTDFVMPGVLEGDAEGILTLEFDNPTTDFSFSLAMDDAFATQFDPVKGFNIELLDELGISLGSPTDVMIFIQPTGGNLWAETQYSYSGGEVKTAVLDFNEGTFDRTVFWLDNLDVAGVPNVPEPGTGILLAAGLSWLGRNRRGRRG